ncbi:hypothetical protein ACRS6Y_09240 [Bacillus cytotoxicus]|uniref:Group-specific protein n=1 Tax=Bacillus cytotoxicus TaxID=580165 RepID=A0AAX2CIZ8_9BACI|nr:MULTISPECIES: hypothetical protein [Bacillus cereus group]AWC29015.1 hypothetical protein CG483_012175 [Bacillus cytotoxicus]AWC33005.1 hypothetical protein CG482_011755 [Bacillus cytotoxicus]AWC37031.1 hypothetical protein CG481_011770 [Bacillus cytotoxicus]AWC39599.1 hypothetical protein CG480_003075 [Bacillus cytotoxicus]AWC47530.1 hypothetical protein CG478_003075 [Bacillus cytotoxicus]
MKYLSIVSKLVFFIIILVIVIDHFELYKYFGLSQTITKTINPFGIWIIIIAGVLLIIEWMQNKR